MAFIESLLVGTPKMKHQSLANCVYSETDSHLPAAPHLLLSLSALSAAGDGAFVHAVDLGLLVLVVLAAHVKAYAYSLIGARAETPGQGGSQLTTTVPPSYDFFLLPLVTTMLSRFVTMLCFTTEP
jgi:hypothetical protein